MLRAIERLGPAVAVAVAALALVAAALVHLGWWNPLVGWPAAVAIMTASWLLVGRTTRPRPEPALDRVSLALTGVITVWLAVLHSGHLVIRRDGGAYALYTQWIATRHTLPVAADLDAFGGAGAFGVERFTLSSPAFYQVLDGQTSGIAGPGVHAEIVPQFLIGAPAVYSLGWWAGSPLGASWTGMQIVPPMLGGLALLCFGTLVGRLVGRRWAAPAIAGLGLAMPMVLVLRTTYSEPPALLMMLSAALLAVEALEDRRLPPALLAGALVGLTGLVRVDAVREVALLVVVCAVLAARGNRVAPAMAVSAVAGSGLSLAVGWWTSRPYLSAVGPSLRPVVAAMVVLALASALSVPVLRRRRARATSAGSPAGRTHRAGQVVARVTTALVLLLGLVLASRPLWLTVRQDPDDTGARFVAILQRAQGLPIDGGRTYAEHSLDWVAWYLGWPAVVVAWIALAVLAGRATRWWTTRSADPPAWLVPTAVGFAGTVLVLVRPGITPDHPWADRRLVPVVIPMIVAACVAGIAWASTHLPQRRPWLTRRRLAWASVVLFLGPVVWASAPISFRRTEAGEVGAVEQVCAQLAPEDVVVAVDATEDGIAQRSGNEWVQVIRGVCGHPAGALLTPSARIERAAADLAERVAGRGGRLVLLTAQEDGENARRVLGVAGAGPDGRFEQPQRAVRIVTTEDRKWLTRRPTGVARLVIDVWLAPARSGPASGSGADS